MSLFRFQYITITAVPHFIQSASRTVIELVQRNLVLEQQAQINL